MTLFLRFSLSALVALAFCSSKCTADTLVRSIIEQNDDAEEAITGPFAGNVQRSSSDLEIGNENGTEQWVGLRFQDIQIPAGAIITSATIQFTAEDTDVGNLIVPILGELSLAPEEFRDVTPLTGRPLTTASVSWDIQPWFPGDRNERTTTPNIAAVLQEIVDQPGWAQGNPLAFIIQNEPNDTSERLAVSFDGNPADAATLTVEFVPGELNPQTYAVVQGIQSLGGLPELQNSDNLDLGVIRNRAQTTGIITVEFETTTQTSNPTLFEFSIESAGFYRRTIVQSVDFFNFTTGIFEEVASQNTSRFADSTQTANGSGDLNRFIDPISGTVRSRVRYSTSVRRQSYSVAIDHVFWLIQ